MYIQFSLQTNVLCLFVQECFFVFLYDDTQYVLQMVNEIRIFAR